MFSNREDLLPSAVTIELKQAFLPVGLFMAHQISMPEAFLYSVGDPTSDDHCFHELDSVELTAEAQNDRHGRSIAEFVTEVNEASQSGWQAFDPQDGRVGVKSQYSRKP